MSVTIADMTCSQCGYVAASHTALGSHRWSAHSIPGVCRSREYRVSYGRAQREAPHAKWPCPECGYRCMSDQGRRIHRARVHKVRGTTYERVHVGLFR